MPNIQKGQTKIINYIRLLDGGVICMIKNGIPYTLGLTLKKRVRIAYGEHSDQIKCIKNAHI